MIRAGSRCHARAREGQALIEFALVMPILLLLIAGIMEFGRAMQIKQVLVSTAAGAVRQSVVADSVTADSTAIKSVIKKRLASASLDSTKAVLTLGLRLTTGTADTVLIKYPYKLKVVGAFMHWTVGTDTVKLQARAVMRNE